MRKRLLLVALMLSVLIVVGFKSVSASTECDRWLQQYKEQLANYTPVKHIRHRIRHYLHPKPRVVRTNYIPIPHIVRPKLSPEEMLRRFHILCGDLPPEPSPFTPGLLLLPPSLPPAFPELTSAEGPPVSVIPPVAATTPVENSPTTPVTTPGGPIGGYPTGPGTPPIGPIISTPPVVTPPVVTPPVVPPVVPPVPEPASLILMLTGFAGVLALNSRK